ncbi:MAG: glycosyltransferase family 4 protein, partial [Gammaproteobacteria bacterium]|nr:glycosyltransferase family 4 protein [Gammaproteobacteria bacterium]
AYWLFNPDPGILWARAAASHPAVQKLATGALFVLSSSPPESAHIGAATLAKKLRAELIIDMRDGWLDEPLKSLLHDSRLQRWREGRLERSILQQADKIFVTSPVWKTLLEDRLPFTHDKTVVLTNAYPPEDLFNIKQARKRSVNGPIRLVHAGRFTGSSLSRRVRHLLEPLLMGLGVTVTPGIVTLLGRLETADLEEVSHLQSRFQSKGWTIELEDAVPREELME